MVFPPLDLKDYEGAGLVHVFFLVLAGHSIQCVSYPPRAKSGNNWHKREGPVGHGHAYNCPLHGDKKRHRGPVFSLSLQETDIEIPIERGLEGNCDFHRSSLHPWPAHQGAGLHSMSATVD